MVSDSAPLNELIQVARHVQDVCEGMGWAFCFIGGVAVQHWGEPRYTGDVDLTLLTGFGNEESYVDTLLGTFDPRREDAKQFALENRVLLLKAKSGIGIDVALGALPFEEEAVTRSLAVEVGRGVSLRLCSAEDLIVMKAFAGRDQDWIDVRSILVRQGTETLNWLHILKHLTPLVELKQTPETLERLQEMRETT